jgi:hypothetical protein
VADELTAVLASWGDGVDSLVAQFQSELEGVVESARAKTIALLQRYLTINDDGTIPRTEQNARVLRYVDSFITESLQRAGYDQVIEEFVKTFPGQLPFITQMLEWISARLKVPLDMELTRRDRAALNAVQATTWENLRTVVDATAAQAKRRALMSVGALEFRDLVEFVSGAFNRTVAEATTLAATSQSMFFRTAASRAYDLVQDRVGEKLKFKYEGPRDKLTRPFCERMLDRTRENGLTREEIEQLDNGQLPNPFITGGGYNCRHQWVPMPLETKPKAKSAPRKPKRVQPWKAETDLVFDFESADRVESLMYQGHPDRQAVIEAKQNVAMGLADRLRTNKTFWALVEEMVGDKSPATLASWWGPFAAEDPVYAACAELVHHWAITSSDNNEWSLAIQHAAEKEFGLKRWKVFETRRQWVSAMKLYEKHGAALRAFVRAQYDWTQEWFAKHGITHVFAWRGMHDTPRTRKAERSREKVKGLIVTSEGQLQPLSSFSVLYWITDSFASDRSGEIIGARIPVSRILSTPHTGFGCLNEKEIVVLSGGGKFGSVVWTDNESKPVGPRGWKRIVQGAMENAER